MNDTIKKFRRGLDIHIKGKAEIILDTKCQVSTFAVKPTDFLTIRPIPKLSVSVGDKVKAGDPIFYDKPNPSLLYTSPVSGEVTEIKRGEKRAIDKVVIKADAEIQYKDFGAKDPLTSSKEEIVKLLKESGVWQSIRQRPFGIVADPDDQPKSIFISCFDTAPLAVDYDFLIDGKADIFQAGLEALKKLTEGKVHLGLNGDAKYKPSEVFKNAKGVQINYYKGAHPAGNVGVHIHHIDPVKKGDVVWYLTPQQVITIGRLFLEGKYNAERVIALAGPEVKYPKYYKTFIGASVKEMIHDNLLSEDVRIISGNVLTGTKIEADGYVGYYDNLVSVILEGNSDEFLGWLMPSFKRPSASRSFISGWLAAMNVKNHFRVRTGMYGEERPFVLTGQFEKVLPMDIYPMYLIKSIMYRDFEEMEGLGIYEVVEEDIALCEFVDCSKTNLQEILREGLEIIRKDG